MLPKKIRRTLRFVAVELNFWIFSSFGEFINKEVSTSLNQAQLYFFTTLRTAVAPSEFSMRSK